MILKISSNTCKLRVTRTTEKMHIVITFPVVPPLMSSMLREEHSSAKIRTPMDESGMDGMTENRETKLGLVRYRFGLISCDDPSNKRDKLITVAKAQEEEAER